MYIAELWDIHEPRIITNDILSANINSFRKVEKVVSSNYEIVLNISTTLTINSVILKCLRAFQINEMYISDILWKFSQLQKWTKNKSYMKLFLEVCFRGQKSGCGETYVAIETCKPVFWHCYAMLSTSRTRSISSHG